MPLTKSRRSQQQTQGSSITERYLSAVASPVSRSIPTSPTWNKQSSHLSLSGTTASLSSSSRTPTPVRTRSIQARSAAGLTSSVENPDESAYTTPQGRLEYGPHLTEEILLSSTLRTSEDDTEGSSLTSRHTPEIPTKQQTSESSTESQASNSNDFVRRGSVLKEVPWRRKLEGTNRGMKLSGRTQINPDSSWIKKKAVSRHSAVCSSTNEIMDSLTVEKLKARASVNLDPSSAPTEIMTNLSRRRESDEKSDFARAATEMVTNRSVIVNDEILDVHDSVWKETYPGESAIEAGSSELQYPAPGVGDGSTSRDSSILFNRTYGGSEVENTTKCAGIEGQNESSNGDSSCLHTGRLGRHFGARLRNGFEIGDGSFQSRSLTSSVGVETGGRSVERTPAALKKVLGASPPRTHQVRNLATGSVDDPRSICLSATPAPENNALATGGSDGTPLSQASSCILADNALFLSAAELGEEGNTDKRRQSNEKGVQLLFSPDRLCFTRQDGLMIELGPPQINRMTALGNKEDPISTLKFRGDRREILSREVLHHSTTDPVHSSDVHSEGQESLLGRKKEIHREKRHSLVSDRMKTFPESNGSIRDAPMKTGSVTAGANHAGTISLHNEREGTKSDRNTLSTALLESKKTVVISTSNEEVSRNVAAAVSCSLGSDTATKTQGCPARNPGRVADRYLSAICSSETKQQVFVHARQESIKTQSPSQSHVAQSTSVRNGKKKAMTTESNSSPTSSVSRIRSLYEPTVHIENSSDNISASDESLDVKSIRMLFEPSTTVENKAERDPTLVEKLRHIFEERTGGNVQDKMKTDLRADDIKMKSDKTSSHFGKRARAYKPNSLRSRNSETSGRNKSSEAEEKRELESGIFLKISGPGEHGSGFPDNPHPEVVEVRSVHGRMLNNDSNRTAPMSSENEFDSTRTVPNTFVQPTRGSKSKQREVQSQWKGTGLSDNGKRLWSTRDRAVSSFQRRDDVHSVSNFKLKGTSWSSARSQTGSFDRKTHRSSNLLSDAIGLHNMEVRGQKGSVEKGGIIARPEAPIRSFDRTDSEGYDDGVTLDLSIADVSGLTNPTCLRSKEDFSQGDSSSPQSRDVDGLEIEGRGPSEASSSQTSEAAAPLLALTMRAKYANSSDDYGNFTLRPFGERLACNVRSKWAPLTSPIEEYVSIADCPEDASDPAWDLRIITERFPETSTCRSDKIKDSGTGVSRGNDSWEQFDLSAFQERSDDIDKGEGVEKIGFGNTMRVGKGFSTVSLAQNAITSGNTSNRLQVDAPPTAAFNHRIDPASQPESPPAVVRSRQAQESISPDVVDSTFPASSKHAALISKLRSLREARIRRNRLFARKSSSTKMTRLVNVRVQQSMGRNVEDEEQSSSTMSSTRFGGHNFKDCLAVD